MKLKAIICAVLVSLMSIVQLEAQEGNDYKLAAGLRFGVPISASAKYFVTDSHALEVALGIRGNTFFNSSVLSGAYLVHRDLDLDGLLDDVRWYFGGGAALWSYRYKSTFSPGNTGNSSIAIQGYLGLEYGFPDLPISVSADWGPSLFLGSGFYTGFGGGYGAVAVRYTLR